MRALFISFVVTLVSAAPFVISPLKQDIHSAVRVPASVEAQAIAFTEFSLIASSEPGCAGDISHAAVDDVPEDDSEDVEGVITFSNIRVNGEQCGAGQHDELLKLYSQDVLDATLPGGMVLNLTFEAARSVTVAGADLAVRTCGSWIEEYEQSYAFSMDIMRLLPSLSESGFIDNSTISDDVLETPAIWMVVAPQEDRGRVCLYKQIVPSEDEDVSPTATPDPNDADSDGEISDSEEDAALEDGDSDDEEEDDDDEEDDDSEDDDEDDPDKPEGNGIFPDANEEALLLEEQDASRQSSCFPASAQVNMEDGSVKAMSDLKVGERVMVAPDVFSDVFMFTHKLDDGNYDFVRIVTDSGKKLSATTGHYIYVNGRLMTAGKASIGDVIELADGVKTKITSISSIKDRGLYNPQTRHGDIIVDGVRVSTYTSAVEPSAAHALLTPLRALYTYFSLNTAYFEGGADHLVGTIPMGHATL